MTLIAPTLQAFFSDRLARQLQASPRTIASYRDSLRLLLCFVQETTGKAPSAFDWDDLDEPLISAFLEHLEVERGNSARTRNLRLTAIRSLFRYAALRHPEHAAVIARVLAIPPKRFEKRAITFLLGTGAHVRCDGKGRKQRSVPLTAPAQAVLSSWLKERAGRPGDPLLPTRTGRRLSRDAIERRLATHAATATRHCPSLEGKRLHPHVLRHSCAMSLLQAGVDTTVIALWLGHADVRSTQPYLHADLTIKERALALLTPAAVPAGRYRPPDGVLAFLEAL
jgi:site-specific recombinase XerD